MAIAVTIFNGLRSVIDRNPVGNLGFSHFSADALVSSLLVGTAQQVDHLQPARILGMIDVLIDSLVVDRVAWVIYPDPSGDLFWRPALFEAVHYVLPDEVVL